MTLAELRRAFSLTQATLAKKLNVKQAEIAKIEDRADMQMSTLGNIVQVMGGDLEVKAVFPYAPLKSAPFRLSPVSPPSSVVTRRNSRWSRLRGRC